MVQVVKGTFISFHTKNEADGEALLEVLKGALHHESQAVEVIPRGQEIAKELYEAVCDTARVEHKQIEVIRHLGRFKRLPDGISVEQDQSPRAKLYTVGEFTVLCRNEHIPPQTTAYYTNIEGDEAHMYHEVDVDELGATCCPDPGFEYVAWYDER